MISTGDKIDLNFEVDVVQDGQEKTVNFMELADRPSVISVYMKNNTSGCDRQNKSLAEHAGWFHEKGCNLIAISKDTCGSHKRYAEKLGAAYTLVSDPEYKFARATDSMVTKKMFGKTFEGPSLSAYVIDSDGTVLGVIEKVNTKAHAEELKELIESL